MALFKSKAGVIGAGFYLLIFLCASMYPLFDKRTFSGLVPALLAWPWIDYLPSALLLVMVALNAIVIYFVLAFLSRFMSFLFGLDNKNRTPTMTRPQKIRFGEMREMGVRGLLVYCSDYPRRIGQQSEGIKGRTVSGCQT